MTDAARADRVEGALLGGACGDALGVPYEFGSAPLAVDEVPRMIGGGLGPYAPGEWSDDTQMAVVIARVAAERGLRDEAALDAVVEGWLDWLRGGAPDVGNQTSSVLGEVAAGPHGGPAQDALLASYALHARTGHTAGNGSLMRTAPVALAFLDDPETLAERARKISGLTHADPLAGDACVLWCHAIRIAVLDGVVPDLADLVTEIPVERRDTWAGWIADAESRAPGEFSPNGFVVTALQAAWSAIRHPWSGDSPAVGGLVAAVHAGNDTDTVAAIAGGLLGAAYGATSLPQQWLDVVHGWPGLRADDVRHLARRVADRGVTDAAAHGVPDELHEVARFLVSRGLGEGHHFVVRGRPVPGIVSSEYVGLRVLDDGAYRVWYSGDRGAPRTFVETHDWAVARQRFVDEVERLGSSRGDWRPPGRHGWRR